jgi:quinol monooxygenase YgiN
MAEPFIFINTFAIKPGKADAFREKFQEVVELVEAKEPQMLHFALHESEDGTQGTVVQVHAHPDNMLVHMELVEDQIRQAAEEYLDMSSARIAIYGTPTDAVLDHIRLLAGSGVPVTISQRVASFDRFPG